MSLFLFSFVLYLENKEVTFMKKYALFALPLLITCLTGCNESKKSLAQYEKDIKAAQKLTFKKGYKASLGTPIEDKGEFDAFEKMLKENSIKVRCTSAGYDESSSASDRVVMNRYNNVTYNLYQDFAAKVEIHYLYDEFNYATQKSEYYSQYSQLNRDFYSEQYDTYFGYSVSGKNNHYLQTVELEGKPENIRKSWIEGDHDEMASFALGNLYGDLYKTSKGYIVCYESYDEYDDVIYQTQYIYKFDKDFHLIRGSYLNEQLSKFDYIKNKKVSKWKIDYYTHEIYYATYGKRLEKNKLVAEVEKAYGRPYFDSIYASFYDCGDDYQTYVRYTPQSVEVEAYIAFDTLRIEPVDVTPYFSADICPSMYHQDETSCVEIATHFTLKSKKLYYSNNRMIYNAKDVSEALYFKCTIIFDKKNNPVFKSGTVKVVDKTYIVDYFDELLNS